MSSPNKFSIHLIGKSIFGICLFFGLLLIGDGEVYSNTLFPVLLMDSTDKDSLNLIFPLDDESNKQFGDRKKRNKLYLDQPSNIEGEFIYDPETDTYIYQEKIGDRNYRNPSYMTMEEYLNYDMSKNSRSYFKERSAEEDESGVAFRPKLYVEGKAFDRIFGGNTIDIRPTGSAELTFGINVSRRDNPTIPERQRRTSTFDFDQKIQLNLVGKVGDKLQITTSYNTEATFDFENQTKIEYTGYDDEIIQKIELGNVALPLNGSLISGSQTLFGVKTQLRFGRLTVTSIFSQERGEKKEINVQGGAQITKFEKPVAEYEDNRHYFLSHFFRDRYETALTNLPLINSNIQITKVEVWISPDGQQIENSRNFVAFADLGEYDSIAANSVNQVPRQFPVADNSSNNLYRLVSDPNTILGSDVRSFNRAVDALQRDLAMQNGRDFDIHQSAQLLQPGEYTVNPQLGYISLNRNLKPAQKLAVAFQYTLNGRTYQVGEFSNQGVEGQDALILKLLKSTSSNSNTQLPIWDLMMKNVYSLNAFSISQDDFIFEIWYLNPETGVEIPYIPEGAIDGKLLLQVMNLDKLDPNNSAHPDGFFDFLPNTTINPSNGRIYFPVLEPFGSHLRKQFNNPDLAEKYGYDSLYSTTQQLAALEADKNRFVLRGQYQSSSSSEIALNSFNIPQGSVVVTMGGIRLVENQDYTVDYNLGRVKILRDDLLESGAPIKISLESNSLFNIQTKTLLGSRFDYKVDEELSFGGTILNLTERPLTRKINIGDEAISNTIWGLDATYTKEAPVLTRLVDKIPLIDTKEKSRVTATVEFAHLIPGNARAITKQGISYVDDFEGSQTQIDLKNINNWKMASTPQGQPLLFPEGDIKSDTLIYGYNRAKLAWYVIDPLFWRESDSRTPDNITSQMQRDHRMREVLQTEVFPNRDPDQNLINNIPVLDLAYYPTERGPYNYVPPQGFGSIAQGLDQDGNLIPDERRWAGIMRDIQTNDFEATNVEFIQFWVMDPYNSSAPAPVGEGTLYFNLGLVSEDILKDGEKTFENGFPWTEDLLETRNTIWGRVPAPGNNAIVNAFANNTDARPQQDIGLDGLIDSAEARFFNNYLNSLTGALSQDAINKISLDPSADNFQYFRDQNDSRTQDILERYKHYNGQEGNSPTGGNGSFTPASTTLPDIEDINRDNNQNLSESYFQYSIPINPQVFNPDNVGNNYMTDAITVFPQNADDSVTWYQFKIPIRVPEQAIGGIKDFRSVQFIRMFLREFEENIVLRFAKLDLIRGEWRKYDQSLVYPGQYLQNELDVTPFVVGAVNVEENSNRKPVSYVIPPGIQREVDFGTSNLRQLNEQSISVDVCDLQDGDARAIYRNMGLDVRQYKRLKMFVHAEAGVDEQGNKIPLQDGDLTAFIRLGTDFDDNYYEYEIPLTVTDWNDLNSSVTNPDLIWPEANDFDIEFSKLIDAKIKRDGLNLPLSSIYSAVDGNRTIRVKGNPTLSEVRVVMLGIKNPKSGVSIGGRDRPDDGQAKCAEVWFNELRLSDFNNSGGWAANATVTSQFADFGSMQLAGSMSTPGFGSIDQKLNERQQETRQQYDFSSNVELGRFAQDVVSVPMYFGISESWVTPRYNPLSPDIEFDEILNSDEYSNSQKDSIKQATVAYTKRKSINFTNVKKLPSKDKKKNHPYDVENVALTYAYTETNSRDFNVEYDNRKEYRGIIAYNYSARPKNYKPLNNNKFLKSKSYLQIVRDFNFYLLPKQYGFQNTFNRDYRERKIRQTTPFFEPIPYYQKQFNWQRAYSLRYDITQALRFNFQANNTSLIEETSANGGRVDKNYPDDYKDWKDTVWSSIGRFGDNLRYNHTFDFNYTVPINKLPGLDWVNLTTRYSGSYFWDRAPIGFDTLGNTIRNSSSSGYNVDLNLMTLYNKVDYLKRLNQKKPKKDQMVMKKREKSDDENPPANSEKAEEEDDERKLNIIDRTALILMGVKNTSLSYTRTEGTILPGYNRNMNMLGFDEGFNAPGFNFVRGQQQDTNFVKLANDNDWLVRNRGGVVRSFTNTFSETYNFSASIRPIKDLNININATYNYTTDAVRGFFWNEADTLAAPRMEFFSPIETGSFSMSFLSYKTSFIKDDANDNSSETFEQLLEYRQTLSRRLSEDDDRTTGFQDTTGYYDGYNGISQEVLIGAFLAAYAGDDPENVDISKDFWRRMPKPNWRVTYDGIAKIGFMQNIVRSFTISHGYRSSYNVNSFTTNLLLSDSVDQLQTRDVISGNIVPKYQIASVSINEQYSPLIGFDVKWKIGFLDNWGTKLEFKRDRNIALSLNNNQITEIKGKEVVIGINKTFPNFIFPFGGQKKREGKRLTTRADVSSRNNVVIIRRIVEGINQAGGGQIILSLKFTADYQVSNKLNVRAFYDRIVTRPKISSSFPTANTNAGIAIRFSLTQ